MLQTWNSSFITQQSSERSHSEARLWGPDLSDITNLFCPNTCSINEYLLCVQQKPVGPYTIWPQSLKVFSGLSVQAPRFQCWSGDRGGLYMVAILDGWDPSKFLRGFSSRCGRRGLVQRGGSQMGNHSGIWRGVSQSNQGTTLDLAEEVFQWGRHNLPWATLNLLKLATHVNHHTWWYIFINKNEVEKKESGVRTHDNNTLQLSGSCWENTDHMFFTHSLRYQGTYWPVHHFRWEN